MSTRRPYRITPQQDFNDQWGFWITAPNHATVARSCRKYTTEKGAVQAAVNLLNAWRSNGIEVVK
jgi:uncharacterized protein YegP (UPF0339 family)